MARTQGRSKEEVRILGGFAPEADKQLTESNPLESAITVNPGKPGFEKGQILGGIYLGTKRCFSETAYSNPKTDDQGRAYRDLHLFEREIDGKKRQLGIFSVGELGAVLPRLKTGIELYVRYDGQADKPLKRGQEPPHKFTYLLANGEKLVIDWKAPKVLMNVELDEMALEGPGTEMEEEDVAS